MQVSSRCAVKIDAFCKARLEIVRPLYSQPDFAGSSLHTCYFGTTSRNARACLCTRATWWVCASGLLPPRNSGSWIGFL